MATQVLMSGSVKGCRSGHNTRCVLNVITPAPRCLVSLLTVAGRDEEIQVVLKCSVSHLSLVSIVCHFEIISERNFSLFHLAVSLTPLKKLLLSFKKTIHKCLNESLFPLTYFN